MASKKADCTHCGKYRPIAGRGWCGGCYDRFRQHGSPEFRERKGRTPCAIPACGRNVVSHGLCNTHWSRVHRFGQTETLRPNDWGKRTKHHLYIYWNDTKKREGLNLCAAWKKDFWAFVDAVKTRPSKEHYIRAVDVTKELGPDNWQWSKGMVAARRQEANRAKRQNHERFRVRCSQEEKARLLLIAGHKCQICGATSNGNDCPTTGAAKVKNLCVDHEHVTGMLRGILCRTCNVALGLFRDDAVLLENAIKYLHGHKPEH